MDKLSRLKLFATCTGSKKLYDKIVNKEPLSAEEKEQVKIINYKYSNVFDSEYLNIDLNVDFKTTEEASKKLDDSVEPNKSESVKDADVKDTVAPVETSVVDDTNETSPIDIDTQE